MPWPPASHRITTWRCCICILPALRPPASHHTTTGRCWHLHTACTASMPWPPATHHTITWSCCIGVLPALPACLDLQLAIIQLHGAAVSLYCLHCQHVGPSADICSSSVCSTFICCDNMQQHSSKPTCTMYSSKTFINIHAPACKASHMYMRSHAHHAATYPVPYAVLQHAMCSLLSQRAYLAEWTGLCLYCLRVPAVCQPRCSLRNIL
jgi:hypothetical protein